MMPTRNASPLDFNGLWLRALAMAAEKADRMYPPFGFETERRQAEEMLALRYYRQFTRDN
jgi:hypothetical protein